MAAHRGHLQSKIKVDRKGTNSGDRHCAVCSLAGSLIVPIGCRAGGLAGRSFVPTLASPCCCRTSCRSLSAPELSHLLSCAEKGGGHVAPGRSLPLVHTTFQRQLVLCLGSAAARWSLLKARPPRSPEPPALLKLRLPLAGLFPQAQASFPPELVPRSRGA